MLILLPIPINTSLDYFSSVAGKVALTTWLNCFFYLFPIAFVIIIKHNGLPQRILPLCLTVKVLLFRTLFSGWLEGRNEQTPSLAILGDTCKINGLFTLLPASSPPPSLSYKRIWHPGPNEMVTLRL